MVYLYLKQNSKYTLYLVTYLFMLFTSINKLHCATNINRYDIVEIYRAIKTNELLLEQLNSYQKILESKKELSKQNIEIYGDDLAKNIVSILKFSFIPLQKLLFAYKNTTDLSVTYALLNYYQTSLKDNLKYYIDNLNILTNNYIKLQNISTEIININKQLIADKKQLSLYLNSKEITPDISKKVIQTKKLFQKTETLTKIMNQVMSHKSSETSKKANDAFEKNNKGKLFPIVNGTILTYFKDPNAQAIHTNGISLLASPNIGIYSPADGEIVFSSNYDQYNSLIIIQHAPSFFSIISGKFTTLVLVGQFVKQNEKIAVNGEKNNIIYYELDKDNQPINPIKWFLKK